MTKIMQRTGLNLPAKEVKGQRVVSYKQIAELHQVNHKIIQNNFNRNQDRFIEGVDYFKLNEPNSDTINLRVSKLYFTESGYLMLVKSLTDDLSWEVQRMLVNRYFRANILERVIGFLPEKVRQVIYYRGLGLTQAETGKLVGISKDRVKRVETDLKRIGYSAPNQSGRRSHFKAVAEQLEVEL